MAAGEPVILEGALDAWELRSPPLATEVLLERLAAVSGQRSVVVATARSNHGMTWNSARESNDQDYTEARCQFGAFLRDLSRADRPRYMPSQVMGGVLPELVPHFPLSLIEGERQAEGPRMWIGNGAHRTAMHYDRDDNLLCIAAGRKRFIYYPPDALPHLYPLGFGTEHSGAATSLVDPLAPDLERFPKFAEVQHRAIIAEVSAGDVLYAPAYWWHDVESFGVNVAVTFFWSRTSQEARLAADACLVHGLIALRSLPPHLRSAYRTLFEHFVFEANGDPYAHLDESRQGWAGKPTPARERKLHEMLKQFVAGSRLFGAVDIDLDHRHVLVKELSFQLLGDNIEMRGRDLPYPIVIPHSLFEILREFTSPRAPTQVARKRYPRDASARRELERMCHALVVRGLLVDCETPTDR